ncbi:thiamine phosphate synthase [Sinomicrobium kalidii]|uniref:thiamine phosphate synthase n=1 Tax=Sinomicrobium kalidii TaxID=2900738 RepID=UPI001E311183|nr:thiamine phosphate synthase [Sinomicrobium kalidii]UGU14486.1 thiamine phosphate synthase [Sinomicrobium kalidii]
MPAPEYIVITAPESQSPPDEIPCIIRMFENGLETLHLRKPGITSAALARLLGHIPEIYHDRVMTHQHFDVTGEFRLKGVHLPEKVRRNYGEGLYRQVSTYREKGFVVSASFHSVSDIRSYSTGLFDYAFLSPVFDSISKKGYKGQAFNLSGEKLPFPVIALGGITPRHIPQLKEQGFAGAALLGYIWKNKDPEDAFKELKRQK